jgi:hypothetical protein
MSSKRETHTGPLVDIDPDAVSASYQANKLDRWSDDRLVSEVAAVVATPRRDRADSFILHAPLELAARRRLLQLIQPSQRHLARLHIVAIAANYQAFGPALDAPPSDESGDSTDGASIHTAVTHAAVTDTPAAEEAIGRLLSSIDAGDLPGVDATATALVHNAEPATVARALAPSLMARTAAAAHAPIFLQFLLNAGRDGRALASMLRPMARELARNPEWGLTWMHEPPTATGGPTDLYQTLAHAPRLGAPGSTFIHPVMAQVDNQDVAGTLLPPALGNHDHQAAARTILRVAAQSMLHDDPGEAPYGWTHCLTLPQAVLAFGSTKDTLAVAATHVLGLRSALGSVDLPPLDLSPLDTPERSTGTANRITALASAAAIRHDAHIAKYALAVIDAAAADPQATDLFLSAGERLIEVWDSNGGHPKDTFHEHASHEHTGPESTSATP